MHLDMGPLYRKIISTDMERRIYGFTPLMASCSCGQIGALNAESFCERVLSCTDDVLTERNSLLGEEELELLIILRMNRDFMVFMREHYSHLVKEPFGRTVVKDGPEVVD